MKRDTAANFHETIEQIPTSVRNMSEFCQLRVMIQHTIELRIRYGETDRMGYAYYGNYATYFEVARVETLRSVGITYKQLEDEGVLLPVVNFNVHYHAPAHYDDLIQIETIIDELPRVRFPFKYRTFCNGKLLNEASTELVFVDESTGKPMRCPTHILELLRSHF
jgi:acyl-CoA thioester hydrolase